MMHHASKREIVLLIQGQSIPEGIVHARPRWIFGSVVEQVCNKITAYIYAYYARITLVYYRHVSAHTHNL